MHDYWHQQKPDKPLFPDLLWSRPERQQQAGKLAIIGGNVQGFAAAALAYAEAGKAHIGIARVILPDSLQKTVGRVFVAGEYVPSTPSGSLSRRALGELLALAEWSDGVLLAGDLARNSETAILLEQFCTKYQDQLTLTKDAVDYFADSPDSLLKRPNTLLVLSFAQLQKIAIKAHAQKAFTFDMGLVQLVERLHDFTLQHQPAVILKHREHFLAAYHGQVSTTQIVPEPSTWRVATAAHASVWWLQNPAKSFEALTTAIYEFSQSQSEAS